MRYAHLLPASVVQPELEKAKVNSLKDLLAKCKSRKKHSSQDRSLHSHIAYKLENKARSAIGRKEPALKLLKHAPSEKAFLRDNGFIAHVPTDQADSNKKVPTLSKSVKVARDDPSDNEEFVDPNSIQSSLSPASYLLHLWNLANEDIVPANSSLKIDVRRPDLEHFALTSGSLSDQITTLRLANDVLLARVLEHEGIDEQTLFSNFETMLHPLSFPFARDNCKVREVLLGLRELSLNIISVNGHQDAFAMYPWDTDNLYTLVPNLADSLRLYAAHVELMEKSPDNNVLYRDWFGLENFQSGNNFLQTTQNVCSSLDISFEYYRAVVGDDLNVSDESGKPYMNMYARFLCGGWIVQMEKVDGAYETTGRPATTEDALKALPPIVHEFQNKCVRLQKRSGIPLHELGWLLMNAYYAHPSYTDSEDSYEKVFSDNYASFVVAHFLEWKKKFEEISADEFAAYLGDVNCYRRDGSGDETLMAKLFKSDAEIVTKKTRRYDPENPVLVSEIDGASGLGDILRRGLGLSRLEWSSVIQLVSADSGASDFFDSAMLGRCYRLTNIFALFDMSLNSGILLLEATDPESLQKLGSSNDCKEVLSAIDRLSWIYSWLRQTELSSADLVTILTETDSVYPTEVVISFVKQIQGSLGAAVLQESDFQMFTEWGDIDKDITEREWLEVLNTSNITDDRNLVIVEDDKVVENVIDAKLDDIGADMDDALEQQKMNMIAVIASKRYEQHGVVDAQLADRYRSTPIVTSPLLSWMDVEYYEVEDTFMKWDLETSTMNQDGMNLVLRFNRFFSVIEKFKLETTEVRMLSEPKKWTSKTAPTGLSLRELYLLSLFKTLQNTRVTVADWDAYFIKVWKEIGVNNGEAPKDQEENHQMLAWLFDWPYEDITKLAEGEDIGIENKCISTIEQANYLLRRINMCRDASMSAKELISFENAALDGSETKETTWEKASTNALACLKRYEGGKYLQEPVNRIDAESRDALLDSFLEAGIAQISPSAHNKTEAVYEYLLLDVNVSGVVPTTKMLENIGSVQLFINRSLDNVEECYIENREYFREMWTLSSEYRMWEANEKLGLFPGNYVEPELRLGQSSLFKEFHREVSNGELNEEKVGKAITRYVNGVQMLSDLKMIAIFPSYDEDYKRTIFCTAVADTESNSYFYRQIDIDELQLSDGSPRATHWGDWISLNLPFAQETVYGVVPMFRWNILNILWLELSEEQVENLDAGDPGQLKTNYYLSGKTCRRNVDGGFSGGKVVEMDGDNVQDRMDVTSILAGVGYDKKRIRVDFCVPTGEVHGNNEKIVTIFTISTTNKDGGNVELKKELGWEWRKFDQQCTIFTDLNSNKDWEWSIHDMETVSDYSCISKLEHSLDSEPSEDVNYENDKGLDNTFTVDYIRGRPDLAGYSLRSNWTHPPSGGKGFQINSNTFNHGRMSLSWMPYNFTSFNNQSKFYSYPNDAVEDRLSCNTFVTLYCRVNRDAFNPFLIFCEDLMYRIQYNSADGSYDDGDGNRYWNSAMGGIVSHIVILPGLSDIVFSTRFDFEVTQEPYAGFKFFSYYDLNDPKQVHVSVLDTIYYNPPLPTRSPNYYCCSDVTQATSSNPLKFVLALSSNLSDALTASLRFPFKPSDLLNIPNQSVSEDDVDNFLIEYETAYDEVVSEPRPQSTFDFNGSFGLYAWELFYHIPELLASIYQQQNQFDLSVTWHKQVFDPSAPDPWKVLPLIDNYDISSSSPTFNDPDEAAKHHPESYRKASIRYYINTLLAKGDYSYRQQTTESLRLAKMSYVNILSLFDTSENQYLFEQSNRENWTAPTLGEATEDDFRFPTNSVWADLLETVNGRLYNLRHWLSIDGDQLTIPLIAPEIDPRELQLARLSSEAGGGDGGAGAPEQKYFFDQVYNRAKAAVENLMYLGDLLSRALRDRDLQAIQQMAAEIAGTPDVVGQAGEIAGMRMELDTLKKEKEQAQKYNDWYTRFSNEYNNFAEKTGFVLSEIGLTTLLLSASPASVVGGLKCIPNIFGLSNGGHDGSGPAEAVANVMQISADHQRGTADLMFASGEYGRRQEENKMEQEASKLNVESLQLAIDKLEADIKDEEDRLDRWNDIIKANNEFILLNKRRTTNTEFYNWYVGRVTWLYNSAYDLTVRFCRLAERAYQMDTGIEGTDFIQPVWSAKHFGLLSGQSLMLNLQRMDYSYIERTLDESQSAVDFTLMELWPAHMEALKRSGQAIFSVPTSLYEDDLPGAKRRLIKNVRVKLMDKEKKVLRLRTPAQLQLLGHCREDSNSVSKKTTRKMSLSGREKVTIMKGEMSTSDIEPRNGRLRPFERCGVQSTWKLSIPALSIGVQKRNGRWKGMNQIGSLHDVECEITYTSR